MLTSFAYQKQKHIVENRRKTDAIIFVKLSKTKSIWTDELTELFIELGDGRENIWSVKANDYHDIH